MLFMLLLRAPDESAIRGRPGTDVLDAVCDFNDELGRAGVLLAAELNGSAGFWLIEVESAEEAGRWARAIPDAIGRNFAIGVRRVFKTDDLGAPPASRLRVRRDRPRIRPNAAKTNAWSRIPTPCSERVRLQHPSMRSA
jgi:hypothetical protein